MQILEGSAPDVDEYLSRLRSQQWKAMAVRGVHEVAFADAQALEQGRRFGRRLQELSDKELGTLGEHCRAAGLEHLFLAALKIER